MTIKYLAMAFIVLGLLTGCLLAVSFVLAQETTAKPAQVTKSQDEVVAEIMSRKGKTYQIDVTHAQEGFDINPRELILHNREQIYPRGLIHVYFGSLKLTSKETPMRLHDRILEVPIPVL